MFFPIGDTQVKGGYKPYVSYSLIGLNVLMYIIQVMTPGNLICELSVVPQDIIQGENYYTLMSSVFMHGGIMHLVGNLLFLWIFADNIEATIGSFRFLLFYLVGGLAASFAHIYFGAGTSDISACCVPCIGGSINCLGDNPFVCEGFIPSLGASGAISAVMGAYLVMFPKSQIKILILILFRNFHISAWIFLGLWFGQNLIAGLGDIHILPTEGSDGVAWWAHIGGFLFGILAGFLWREEAKKVVLEKIKQK